MRFISLFAGIGGFDLGMTRAGMECVAQVEIDKDCRKVLTRHFPEVIKHEDVRTFRGDRLAGGIPRTDVICGGFPCQDLSVAGRRAGLDGERSGLWFDFHRIVHESRPRWVVIENVPGLLSSNGGADFAVVLQGLVECGYGVCWRILDAQHFGLAQRRKRVFIVASLGSGRAAQVLFESEGSSGNPQASRASRADIAPTIESGINRTGGTRPPGTTVDTAHSLIPAGIAVANCFNGYTGGADDNDAQAGHIVAAPGVARQAKGGFTDPVNDNIIAFDRTQVTSAINRSNPQTGDPCHTLAKDADAPYIAFDWQSGGDVRHNCSNSHTSALQSSQTPAVAYNVHAENSCAMKGPGGASVAFESERSRSLDTNGGYSHNQGGTVASGPYGVRRLMPVECERLQGFKDGWTDGQSDSVRYRQLGNAVAVPCAEWIGRRIMETDK